MLEVKNLKKNYGPLPAVRGVSFELGPGDIFGFIGSNGAGKTTTIRMLATLLEPTSGTAVLDGFDILKHPMDVRRRIGFMPDFFGLYDEVKVWEYLDFFAAVYQVPALDRSKVIDQVLGLTDLTGKRDAFVSSLSRGMQQRLCLAKCLVHNPTLLLLDEPASGLDPRARAELKELISELGRMGKIVIVSSHILPELADFCTMVGIIEQGEMRAFGTVEDVARMLQEHKVLELRVIGEAQVVADYLAGKPHVIGAHVMGSTTVKIEFSGTVHDQAALLSQIIAADFRVIGFQEVGADLEDVFLKVTSGVVQ